MPDIACEHLLQVGQVWEKINGPGHHWNEELGNLVIITELLDGAVKYRHLPSNWCHQIVYRPFHKFEGRFKLVKDI